MMRIDSSGRFAVFAGIFLTAAGLFGQKKLAQTGFEFLSVPSLGRASAMGDAYTCVSGSSTALLYNPAGLAGMASAVDMSASRNRWIADITHYSFTASFRPWKERYGVAAISALWVDYGEFLGTMVWNNGQGYVDTETFTPKAMAVGIGYAKSLTDKFSVGGQIKWVAQSSGRNVVPSGGSADRAGRGEKRRLDRGLRFRHPLQDGVQEPEFRHVGAQFLEGNPVRPGGVPAPVHLPHGNRDERARPAAESLENARVQRGGRPRASAVA